MVQSWKIVFQFFNVSCFTGKAELSTEYSESNNYLFLGRDIGQLFDTGDFADFTLYVGRRSFKCHKAILSARSPFFQGMFRNHTNQESVKGEVGHNFFLFNHRFVLNAVLQKSSQL